MWSNSPGAFYQWINCKDNSPIVGATNQGYTTLVGGSYAVIVNNGTCIDTSECKTTFSVNTTEYFNSNNIEIKPNPANNELFINSNIEFSSVKIYNLLSEILLESKITPTKQHVISISELKNGIYLVNINGKFVQKIVVMRD